MAPTSQNPDELPIEMFKGEMSDLLVDLESALLAMETRPGDSNLVSRVFRALHTIKGSSSMFGLDSIARFTHEVESVFDKIRCGERTVTADLITFMLAALDQIKELFAASYGDGVAEIEKGDMIIDALKQCSGMNDEHDDESESFLSISSFLGVLTDYELSRIKANMLEGKHFFSHKFACLLEEMNGDAGGIPEELSKCGEIVSLVPISGADAAGRLNFNCIIASSLSYADIEQRLGYLPRRINMSALLEDSTGFHSPPAAIDGVRTFRIRFKPSQGIIRAGFDPLSFLADLREMGTCLVVAQTGSIPPLETLDPNACYTSWDLLLTTSGGEKRIREAFASLMHDSELTVEQIDDSSIPDSEDVYKRLGEILVERGDINPGDLECMIASRKRIGEILVESNLVPQGAVHSALVEQQRLKEIREGRQLDERSSIRVSTEKLDSMVNLVSELVIAHARISLAAQVRKDEELGILGEEIGRLCMALRDNVLSIRTVPVGTMLNRFRRMVRDLAADLGKEVEIVISGGETELDKTIIDKLNDPLVHLIRNAIDHGIEPPNQRKKAGKNPAGVIHMAAVHSGDSVLLTIRDDGGGMDREAILARALEKGIVSPGTILSDSELFSCVFIPGFSTAKSVTDISGRGVGMDVVRQVISDIRGEIDIQSVKGTGTTITIKVPLTLAIIESLLVKIGRSRFVIPLSVVEECLELKERPKSGNGRMLMSVREELVPYVPLRDQFGITGAKPDIEQMVITRVNGIRVGFLVDKVIGEHQTVIKPLGRLYRKADGFSGATILGDGNVALILDLPKMVKTLEQEETCQVSRGTT